VLSDLPQPVPESIRKAVEEKEAGLHREPTLYDRHGYYRNPLNPNAEEHNILSQMFEILGEHIRTSIPDISTRTLAIDHLIEASTLAHVALEQKETVQRNAG
jgi:hypothetical protein